MAETLRSQSTGSDLNLKCKMSSRRGNYSGGSSSKTTESGKFAMSLGGQIAHFHPVIMPYNAAASMKRLQQKGFHKKVSNASVQSEIAQWYATRDDSDKYRKGDLPSFGRYADANELVKVWLKPIGPARPQTLTLSDCGCDRPSTASDPVPYSRSVCWFAYLRADRGRELGFCRHVQSG